MISVVHCALGEGFHRKFEPMLDQRYTLYIGSKAMAKARKEEWWGFHVDYHTWYNLPRSLERCDQVVIEQLPINPRAQRCIKLVELLRTDKMKPIFFRPQFGKYFDYLVLEDMIWERPVSRRTLRGNSIPSSTPGTSLSEKPSKS